MIDKNRPVCLRALECGEGRTTTLVTTSSDWNSSLIIPAKEAAGVATSVTADRSHRGVSLPLKEPARGFSLGSGPQPPESCNPNRNPRFGTVNPRAKESVS